VPLFDGALPKNSLEPDAAVALLRFLSSPEAARVITKAGLRPLAPR
jgi:molybdate transport system substrate-binding protein